MVRFLRPFLIAAVLSLFAASVALGANPHLKGTPSASVTNAGALRVTGSIAGLGQSTAVVELTATGYCQNPGGNAPPGQLETVSGTQVIDTVTKNGNAAFVT